MPLRQKKILDIPSNYQMRRQFVSMETIVYVAILATLTLRYGTKIRSNKIYCLPFFLGQHFKYSKSTKSAKRYRHFKKK